MLTLYLKFKRLPWRRCFWSSVFLFYNCLKDYCFKFKDEFTLWETSVGEALFLFSWGLWKLKLIVLLVIFCWEFWFLFWWPWKLSELFKGDKGLTTTFGGDVNLREWSSDK